MIRYGKSKEESAASREPKSRAGAFKPNLMKGEEPHEAALTNRTVKSYGAQDLVSLRGAESSLPVPLLVGQGCLPSPARFVNGIVGRPA